ncbi:MAG: hypothetical protein KAH33_00665 [Candidatus Delongbacteria bacterium]|nr:hypothetical protein [Candidatus Delongbacteria bacterium]
MKKLMLLTIILGMCSMYAISKIEFSAKTGDKELDISLTKFNAEASLNIKSFNTEMTTNYKVTEKKLDILRVKANMQPADIYMALEVSKISKKPMEEVVSSFKKNKSKGWGKMAKDLGIKPGSKEFKALKKQVKERKQKKGKKKVQKKEQEQIKKNNPEKLEKPKKNKMKVKKESKGKGKK